MKKFLGIVSVLLMITACTSGDDSNDTTEENQNPDSTSFDRSAMLANWADGIIIPGYVDFNQKVEVLELATANFVSSPDDLSEVRKAWTEAYTVWQRVSMFEIGPAEVVDLRLNVNIYPTNIDLLESNVTNGDYNLALASNRAAKGFPAIDYLLYGLGEDDAEILAVYTGSNAALYRQYLSDIVVDIKNLSSEVLSQWQGDYRDTFVNNDGASATASVDRFVNDYIFYFEKFLRAGKMGIPGGVFSGNVEPNNLETLYEGTLSKSLFLEGLDASQDFFNGVSYNGTSQGESLNTYLVTLNSVKNGVALHSIINESFDTTRASVNSLESFKTELENTPPINFLEAYDDVQRIVPLLKVDMVSAMSIRIDFADADGD